MRDYHFVYILSSKSRSIYVGLTNNLFARVMEHRAGKSGSYTARYRITRLVYVEKFKYINDAIAREKQFKDWRRERKITLIEGDNPTWATRLRVGTSGMNECVARPMGYLWLSSIRRGSQRSLEQQIPPLRYGMTDPLVGTSAPWQATRYSHHPAASHAVS